MEKTFRIEKPIVGYVGKQVSAEINIGEGEVNVLRQPKQKADTGSLSLFITHSLVEGRLWVDASGLNIEPGKEHPMKFNASIQNGVLTEK